MVTFFDMLVPEGEGKEELDAVMNGGWSLDNVGSLGKVLFIDEDFLSLETRVESKSEIGI